MSTRLFSRALLLAGLLALPSLAVAQERQVTGVVTKSAGGAPIADALVNISGALRGHIKTTAEGRYTISVPNAAVSLTFRAIGFQRKEIVVPVSQGTVNVALDADIFKLEEVVVTGQATEVSRRNATTSVSYVSGDEVSKVASPNIDNALYGKIAGVNIQSNSGAPGGGGQFQIRGPTTILGAIDPLYIVDGVAYSNARILGGRAFIDDGAYSTEDDAVNRVSDINPADIASIEILKGAAASSIYGSKASNGVVIINTIRGQNGKTRVNVSQRLGTSRMLKGYESRKFTLAEAEATFGSAVDQYAVNGQLPYHNLYDQVYSDHGLSYETVADVSGGNDNTKFFLSGTWKHDEGIETGTGFGRQGVRLNLDQRLSPKVDVKVSTVFNRSLVQRGWDNNCNNYGCAGYAMAYIPGFVNLEPNADGSFPLGAVGPLANPLQTSALAKNATETYRFTGGATLNYQAYSSDRSSLRLIAAGGADYFNQNDNLYAPPDLFWEAHRTLPGVASNQDGTSRQVNWNLNGVHTYRTTNGFQATTSFGAQYEDRQLHTTRITTSNLIPGQSHVDAGTNDFPNENFLHERTVAFYGQEELLLFNDRLTLAGGLRAERSSVNGNTETYYFFPKVSGAYRFPNVLGQGSEVKLRLAYGQTGNQPLFGQKFTVLNTPKFGGQNGFTVSPDGGSPVIRPETKTEYEGGLEGTLWHGRATFDLTGYSYKMTNLLLQRVPAPSSGFNSQAFNGGSFRVQGIEVALGVTPIQKRDLSWVSNLTFTTLRTKMLTLEVPPFEPPLSGYGLGDTYIEVGQPLTRLYGTMYGPDGTSVIQGTIGNTNPDFRLGFVNNVNVKAVNFSMVWDWQQGGSVENLTRFLYDDGKNSADYGSAAWQKRIKNAFQNGVFTDFIEKATFLKLRELSIGVSLPKKWVSALGWGVDNARVTLTGRNLLMFAPYSGLDPEVSAVGAASIRSNIDITPYPPSRSFYFNISVGF